MIQLEMFEDDEIVTIRHQVNSVKSSVDKQRKALFARNGELQKQYNDLVSRMEILERNICR